MDLREVLVAALTQQIGMARATARLAVACFLARLSQSDVLDEFERRVVETRFSARPCSLEARQVLSDMLGGGS